MTTASEASERLSAYHIVLLLLLGIATLYEGFDASMLTLASVDVRATLGIGLDDWGTVYAITRAGMVASFFFLMGADHFGRRNLLVLTVAGFSLASLATAFAQPPGNSRCGKPSPACSLRLSTAWRSSSPREELPSRFRGTGITVLTAFATVGTVAMAKASPFFLLLEGAAGNPAHDFAMSLVGPGRRAWRFPMTLPTGAGFTSSGPYPCSSCPCFISGFGRRRGSRPLPRGGLP